jgi:uncharacterized protein YhbP (UPF0306 family)
VEYGRDKVAPHANLAYTIAENGKRIMFLRGIQTENNFEGDLFSIKI